MIYIINFHFHFFTMIYTFNNNYLLPQYILVTLDEFYP